MYFDFFCLICLEYFTIRRTAIKLSCGHLVCNNCINCLIELGRIWIDEHSQIRGECPYSCNIFDLSIIVFDVFEESLRAFERRKIKNFEIYKPVNSLFDHRQDLLNYLMEKINFDLKKEIKKTMNKRRMKNEKNEEIQKIQILKASIEKMIDQSLSRDNDILDKIIKFDQLIVLTDLIYEVETENSQNVSALFFFTADNPQLENDNPQLENNNPHTPICFILWTTDIHYVDDINIDMI
jgi:hypothetical protein